MRIFLKGTPEQSALIKALGHKNTEISRAASEILGAFAQQVVSKVILQAGVANRIFIDLPYNEDDAPTFPIDLYADADKQYLTTWSQTVGGGIPTSRQWGEKEMYFDTYRIDGAFAFDKKYVRKSRFDVVSLAIERMGQEVLYKQELNAFAVLLTALAEARTNGADHVISAAGSDFVLADLSALITLSKRINSAWTGGTPAMGSARGLTDLIVSPEIMEDVRAFAFNPINTKAPDGSAITSSDTGIPLDDITRREIFKNVGMSEIYGVNLIEMHEFGVGANRLYNYLFDQAAGSGITFNSATEEILVGLDLSGNAFVRPVATNSDSGDTFTVLPDDQFPARSDTIGWYGRMEEGRVVTDARKLMGIIV